jgi:dTDP-4-amino-4,6-dideoxygalactose transaminase
MIPMVDLQRQYLSMRSEIDAAIGQVLEQCRFILGPNVAELEKEIAQYHGLDFAVGVANGTDALLLALQACGIAEGDEVITTPFTFIATAEVVGQLKAVPVFTDIDPVTFNVDPDKIKAKITKKTKAVVPVHLFGLPADMDPIMDLARKYGLKVIEDCAQAFGAEYKGKKVGTIGDFGCFSFFPSKNLACYGDGGMVITRDAEAAERVRILRNHGSRIKYHHHLLGWNSRLDEMQAAILRIKLKRIDAFNDGRRRAADLYRKYITRADVTLPREIPGCRHVYHQYTLRAKNRDRIAEALNNNGIASAVYYPVPLHKQEVFSNLNGDSTLVNSEACAADVLSLPVFPEIREDEIRFIAEVIDHA